METKPVKRPRGAAQKYDWDTLRSRGWIFIPVEGGHLNQGSSIRAAARHQGLVVSALMANQDDANGYVVELRQ